MKLCKQEVNVRRNKLLSLWKNVKFFFQSVFFFSCVQRIHKKCTPTHI